MHNIPFRGAERCLKALTPTRQGKLRLICFPHAGGSAGTFRAWSSLLRSDIELFAMQYPGREDRADEAPACQHRGLVAELQQALAPLQDKPCVFFGHSLGGRLALATALSARLPPIGLIVSACSTPYAAKHGHLLRLTRSALIETLHESGQTAAITDENADLLDAYKKTAARTGGVAVGRLQGSNCGVCRMAIEGGRLIDMKGQGNVAPCPQCGRLLILE